MVTNPRTSAGKTKQRCALITGATGQDASYLIELLLQRGYAVHAQSRQKKPDAKQLRRVEWHHGSLTDEEFLKSLIATVGPDELYNLAAISRPTESWTMPDATFLTNALVPQRIFELVRKHQPACRVFQATSSEIFGNSNVARQSEQNPCHPQTPYAISKLTAHLMVAALRRYYGLHISSGIMFNHESPRRPLSYVSQKIAHAAAAIALGIRDTKEKDELGRPIVQHGSVQLGNLDVQRDFGFAGDYVQCMYLMLQNNHPDDYVIATGVSHSIRDFCEVAFRRAGVDWRDHVTVDETLVRKIDSYHTTGESSKASVQLGWQPKTSFVELVNLMVDDRIRVLSGKY